MNLKNVKQNIFNDLEIIETLPKILLCTPGIDKKKKRKSQVYDKHF